MVYRRNSFLTRSVSLLLAFLVFCTCFATPVEAATATTEGNVGSSLYSVSTALTAFASNVVGPNTNDKHGDLASGSSEKDHKLYELSNAGVGNSNVGNGGAIIGYGDKTRGFSAYISSNETMSVTTSSYGTYADNKLGENSKAYVYARYGRLLTDLGIDKTGNPSAADPMRTTGKLLQGCYLIASFIPTMFELAWQIMEMLNPFRFFAEAVSVGNTATGTNGTNGSGTMANPFSPNTNGNTGGVDVGNVTNEAGGLMGNVTNWAGSPMQRVSNLISSLYVQLRGIGMWVILPLMLALLFASILLFNNTNKWPKIQAYIVRFVFICVGIPLLGVTYTAMLDELHSSLTLSSSPSTRLVASSFVDFENWVKKARIDPPDGATLVSSGTSGESESQGKPSADSWRTVRTTIYAINKQLDLYNLAPASLGLGTATSVGAIDTNAGMWNTNGVWNGSIASGSNKEHFNRMNAMLEAYADSDFYTASSWESNVNASITKDFPDRLGGTMATSTAATNKNTVYQMYYETDEVDDWMDREIDDNAKIFGGSAGSGGVEWGGSDWNIFCNGATLGVSADNGNYASSYTFTPSGGGSWGDATKTGTTVGLSTISMYNYLCSAFNESNIAVYSASNASSEYTKQQHYSVNLAGSGFTGTAFMVNCIVCIGIYVVLGVFYCLGMVINNLKQGFSLIMAIPGAMLGVMKSIVQVIVYVVKMLMEVMATVFLYQVVMDLVIIFATVIETPILEAAANVTADGLVGSIFAAFGHAIPSFEAIASCRPLFGLGLMFMINAGVLAIGFASVKLGRVLLTAYAYADVKVMRMLTLAEMRPVFDRVIAERNSLYVWDNVIVDMQEVGSTVGELVAGVGTAMEGGVTA